MQLGFFETAVEPPPQIAASLDDYAFLYTATAEGNNSGIRFMMSRDDAMAWCESDISRGVLYGTPWAYFWTSVRCFIEHHNLYPEESRHSLTAGRPRIDIRKLADNGQWDERIASLGLRKIGFGEFRDVLEPLGVEVLA